MPIEEPKFSLALQDGAFELRDYAASVVAEVAVTGTQDQASRKGFGLLAGYIFGGNGRRQKIAMTAPVTKFAAPEGWRVRFTMPARHALEDLPAPDDPAVTLHEVNPARYGVLRFSGLAGEAKVAEATARLQAILAVRGLVPVGPATIARYNPPWTPWFLRRNEVMFPVTGR